MQIGRSMCTILGTKTSAPGLWQEVKEINLKDNIVCILWWHDFICLQNSAGNKMDIQLKSSYILDMHAKSRERESERWVLGQWTYEVLIHRNKSRLEMAVLSHSAPSSTTVAWETTGWGQTHTDTFRNWVFRPISSNFFCKRNFRPIFWIFFSIRLTLRF